MSSLQAVLWDMDGTLVDTEPFWIAAEYQLVAAHGGRWSEEHAKALIGLPLLVSARYIAKHGGVDLLPEQIVDLLLVEVIARTETATSWRPGVLRLLKELNAQGVPCAMVTMSYLKLAEAVANQLPPGTFDTLVTGDVLERGKPDPEAYLTAAARLGVDPRRCVAIEDSPPGIASAEAAGCVVLAVPNQVPIAPADGRTLVQDLARVDVSDLISLVEQRLAGR
jgi:HAD superfamily hydrolase (TIGR01509 family)